MFNLVGTKTVGDVEEQSERNENQAAVAEKSNSGARIPTGDSSSPNLEFYSVNGHVLCSTLVRFNAAFGPPKSLPAKPTR